ncbi:putative inhibitor of apoptosis [Melanaphis sacchari]|uniref:putative inhibitor of apoptosis n=1 Tax=Melanaphis sacchari TaxID=742174 RepID=UPI000DC15556|nr:putative inhibitor of apoptosis [Melanaphis sacchari]
MAHQIAEEMTAMERCLLSFNETWPINFLRPYDMARAGFFYSGVNDEVECHVCGIEFYDWKHGDDPLQLHTRYFMHCPFIKEILASVDGRLRTFNNWPLIFLRPREMVDAGFFYTGKQDEVRCTECFLNVNAWKDGDVPLVEHRKQSRFCTLIQGFGDIYVTCGLYNSSVADVMFYKREKNIETWLHLEGIMQRLKPFGGNKMISFDARLKTFDNCPRTLKQDINTLCKAGFFYSGNGQTDFMTCFFCAITLRNWTDNDEPWAEHAKWSDKCGHLFLTKGKNFVDAKQEKTYVLNNKMKIQMTKKHVHGVQLTKTLFFKKQHHLSEILDSSSVLDCMLCKICYKEKIKVVFVPCGHAIACIECALNINYCAICRYPFHNLMRVYLCTNEENYENSQLASSSSNMSSSNTLNPMLCQICFKEEMRAVLLPCRHVYSCSKCAEEISLCSVCRRDVFSLIKLYF